MLREYLRGDVVSALAHLNPKEPPAHPLAHLGGAFRRLRVRVLRIFPSASCYCLRMLNLRRCVAVLLMSGVTGACSGGLERSDSPCPSGQELREERYDTTSIDTPHSEATSYPVLFASSGLEQVLR